MLDHTHDPQVLHKDQYGYLVYCPCCYGFQLSYGTFYINQSLADLESFADLIYRYYQKFANREEQRRRDIYLETPYAGFGLLFSARDLEILNTMLQSGLLLLSSKDTVSHQ
ncbi:MAG: DUF6686 family protein [Bacteroidota bacterium]